MPKSRPSDADAAPATLASAVFEKLRFDILEGHIPPGEKLRIEALCERYEVGASPVREALNRLTALGLAEQVDRRGFRVPAVSLEEFDELSRTRCWVNDVTIRDAIAHGDQAWEEGIALAYHRLWRTPVVTETGGLNRDWGVLHRRFHSALIAACPSKWLRGFHETLFDYAERHRHLYARSRPQGDPNDEHRRIMEAVVRRDADLAVQLLNDAVRSLRPRVEEAPAAPKPAVSRPRAAARAKPKAAPAPAPRAPRVRSRAA